MKYLCNKTLQVRYGKFPDFIEGNIYEATTTEVVDGDLVLWNEFSEEHIITKEGHWIKYFVPVAIWNDDKGREILVHTMSDKWLNNIRKKFSPDKIKPIIEEIKRRSIKRKN